MNEFLEVPNIDNFENVSVQVFTRLGAKVCENTEYKNDWTGRYTDGALLSEGAYYYVLEARVSATKTTKMDGSVTIPRQVNF